MALLPEDAHVDATPEDLKDEADRKDEAVEGLKDLAEPLKFSSVYIVRPMKSRKHAEDFEGSSRGLHTTAVMWPFPVNKIHADRAREYNTKMLDLWAASRDIDISKTQGDDAPQNGTAERRCSLHQDEDADPVGPGAGAERVVR